MIIASLLAAMLSVPVSAAQMPVCTPNAMTAEWEKITLALWITDYTIPDSSPRAATLRYRSCVMGDHGEEIRFYGSDDGAFSLNAMTNSGGANGATTLTLINATGAVRLGTWAHQKVFYKGVGIDKVAVPNGAVPLVKNVFVIPEEAVVKP
jgi:hypothetical protein